MLDHEDTLVHQDVEADPREALAREVARGLSGDSAPSRPSIYRITLAVDDVEPLRWLQAQPDAAKFYWADRPHDRVVAAVGEADVLAAPRRDYDALEDALDARLRTADAAARYFGGVRFDHAPDPDLSADWQAFGSYRFVLPRFELTASEGETRLTCNLILPRDADRAAELRRQIQRLAWPSPRRLPSLPQPIGRADAPERVGWIQMIDDALEAIRRDTLEKVVLARRSTFEFEEALDPFVLLQQLQAATPGCFHFGVQPVAGNAFVGASPERLFRCADGTVWSEAIAGTRSRGDSAQADAALRDELLDSEKDRREHAFVQAAIRDTLAPLCSDVTLKETASEMRLARGRHLRSRFEGQLQGAVTLKETASEMRLARGRHLRSRFEGQLQGAVTPVDLLRALHPTPAVGGAPTGAALDFIRTAEPFDRGWYAGPVGWIGREAAEFAVALRCGRVTGSELALYSGAGIVEGSVPEREWDEIEQKISDFAAVLDLNA